MTEDNFPLIECSACRNVLDPDKSEPVRVKKGHKSGHPYLYLCRPCYGKTKMTDREVPLFAPKEDWPPEKCDVCTYEHLCPDEVIKVKTDKEFSPHITLCHKCYNYIKHHVREDEDD
jgi:hypothetical protein